jgi:ribosomal subunit interface protein
MQFTITAKQVDLGEAFQKRVDASLGAILEKYFKTAVEGHVVVCKEAHLFRAVISLHIGRRIIVNAGATGPDSRAAFDAAAERVAKRLRRHKRRLRAHHARVREESGTSGWIRTDLPARLPQPLSRARSIPKARAKVRSVDAPPQSG